MRWITSARARPVCVRNGSTRFFALVVPLSDSFAADAQDLHHFIGVDVIGHGDVVQHAPERRACAAPPILPRSEAMSFSGWYQALMPRLFNASSTQASRKA